MRSLSAAGLTKLPLRATVVDDDFEEDEPPCRPE
jgi:hypothetical protein